MKFITKILIAVFLVLLFFSRSNATVTSYCFEQTTGSYTPVTDGTAIVFGSVDDDRSLINIGFPFAYNGQTYTQMWVGTNGFVQFGATDPGANFFGGYLESTTSIAINGIAVFNEDLDGREDGIVSYKVEGTEPNRTLIVQYLNWHAYDSDDEASLLNMQLRLSESGNIRVVFGECSSSFKTGVSIGLKGNNENDFNGVYGDNFSNLQPLLSNNQTTPFFETSTPALGLTFSWNVSQTTTYNQSRVKSIPEPISINQKVGQHEIALINLTLCGSEATSYRLNSMSFNAEGTSNLASVDNAKLFYTVDNTDFSTAVQVAGTITNLNGVFTFTPTTPFTLTTNKNYFWLTYQLNNNANANDVLMATCTNIALRKSDNTTVSYVPSPNVAQRSIKYLVADYCLTQSMTDYTSFTDGTPVVFDDDDSAITLINFGFPIPYNGQIYTQAWVSTNGWIQFGSENPGDSFSSYYLESDFTKNGIAIFNGDLESSTDGVVSYKVEGSEPNRTFVLQYSSWVSYDDQGEINMQLRLSETGAIQIKYGTCSNIDEDNEPRLVQIGIKGDSFSDYNGVYGADFSSLEPMTAFYQVIPFLNPSVPASGLTIEWEKTLLYVYKDSKVRSFPERINADLCAGQQNVAKIIVDLCGAQMPPSYSLSSMSFNSEGTTKLENVVNAKLYYTNYNDAFSTNYQVGGTITDLNGVFTFTPSAPFTLYGSKHIFWLTYDLTQGFGRNDSLKATCTNIALLVDGTPLNVIPSPNSAVRKFKKYMIGNYTVGNVAGADFPSLTSAWEALTLSYSQGDITFRVISDLSESVILTPYGTFPEGSAFNVTILPYGGDFNLTTPDDNSQFVILVNDVSNVTIGDPSGAYRFNAHNSCTSEDFTVTCLAVSSTNNPSENITITNCNISTGTSHNDSYGIFIDQEGNNYFKAIGNRITKCYCGIYGYFDNAMVTKKYDISNNVIGDLNYNNSIYYSGIYFYYLDSSLISNNEIYNASNDYFYGINIGYNKNVKIANNYIHDINSVLSYGIRSYYSTNMIIDGNIIKNLYSKNDYQTYGIYYSGNASRGSNSVIKNNYIGQLLNGGYDSEFPSIVGLFFAGNGGTSYINNIKVLNNTFAMYGNVPNTYAVSANVYINSTTYRSMELTNNIFCNSIIGNDSQQSYGVWANATGMISISGKNDFFTPSAGGKIGRNNATDILTIEEWSAFTGNIDVTSINVDPLFSSIAVPILQAGSPLRGFGVTHPDITVDNKGLLRPTPPSIGAFDNEYQLLISPANNAVEVPVMAPPLGPTVFTWSPVAGATRYHIQVAKDASFLILKINQDVADATTLSTELLETSTQYFWRLQAFNGENPINYYSEVWNFGTTGPLAVAPQLLRPANNSSNVNIPVSLAWTQPFSAQQFVLQLSTNSTFSTLFFQETINTTTVSLLDEIEIQSFYYWRVKAIKPGYESPWSETFTFSTNDQLDIFNQPFDNPPNLDLGWTSIGDLPFNVIYDGVNPQVSPRSPIGMGSWNSFGSFGTNSLISPLMTINSTSDILTPLSLWFYRDPEYDDEDYIDEGIQVYINTEPTDENALLLNAPVGNVSYNFIPRNSTFEPVVEEGWHNYKYIVPSGISGDYYVIIKAKSELGNDMYIDDITYTIKAIPYIVNAVATSQLASAQLPKGTKIHHNVLGVEIATEGNQRPVRVDQFTFNTNGTTNTNSIKNARLFLSGVNPFLLDDPADLQVGQTIEAPNGVFTIDAAGMILPSGNSHFWLTFEIPEEAQIGSYVDAECTNVKLNGVDYAPATPGQQSRYQVRGLNAFDRFNEFYVFTNNNIPANQLSVVNPGENYYTGFVFRPGNILKYDNNGNIQSSIQIPNWPGNMGLIDFAYDGTYYYGTNTSNAIYKFTLEPPTIVSTITLPAGIRANSIAYDANANGGAGGFWVSGWASDIVLIDRAGAELLRIPAANHNLSGMIGTAWDKWTPGGPYLWVFDQNSSAYRTNIVQLGNLYAADQAQRGLPTGITKEVALDVFQGINDINFFSAGGLEMRIDPATQNYYLYGAVQFGAYKNRVFECYMGNMNPMIAVSEEVTTASEDYLTPGAENQDVIRINVFTKGQAEPIIVNGLNLQTLGTTNPEDIVSVTAYYTGAGGELIQFGPTVVNPPAEFRIDGVQALHAGNNYFMIKCNISAAATVFNHIDLKCDMIYATRQSEDEIYYPLQNDDGFRQVIVPLSGIYSVGDGGQFLNFSKAFSATNLVGLAGDVEFQIISDITEPSVANLFEWSESGGSNYTMKIYPVGLSRTIRSFEGIIFAFYGADRVTIDGSIDGTGLTRNLSFDSEFFLSDDTQIFSPIAYLRLNANGSNNNTIQNCNIKGGCNNGSKYSTGILIYPVQFDEGEDSHDILIKNNSISRAALGIYLETGSTTSSIYGVKVIGNDIGSINSNSYITLNGLYANKCGASPDGSTDPVIIKGNNIFNIQNSMRNTEIAALHLIDSDYLNISNNKIYDVKNYKSSSSTNFASEGIHLENGNHTSIINNAIYGIQGRGSYTTANSVMGIKLTTPQNNNVYYNSINLYGSISGSDVSNGSTCLYLEDGSNNSIKNNIFANGMPWSKPYSIYLTNPTLLAAGSPDYNDYYAPIVANVMGQDKLTLLDLHNSIGQDNYSISDNPQFIANSNLDVIVTSPVIYNGVQIPGVDADINGIVRTSQPTIGAYEYSGTDLLPTPIVIAPLNNTYAVAYNPCTFTWRPVDNAAYYRLEWTTDPTFASSTIVDVTDLNYSVVLETVTRYYFRIKAFNDLAQSNWTRIYTFYTNGILAIPVLVSPANNADRVSLNAFGRWNEVAGASHYIVQICNNPNFVGGTEKTVNTNTIQFSNLEPAVGYFWRARSTNGSYTSEWSELFRFSTIPVIVCESGPQTGVNEDIDYPSIYSNYFKTDRFQMLIRAEELRSCGLVAGNVSSIAFNIISNTDVVSPILNFKLSMKNTTASEITEFDVDGTWTQVFGPVSYYHFVGWNTHDFTTPFQWDGESNIIVDGCMDSRFYDDWSANCVSPYSTTTFNSYIVAADDDDNQCADPTIVDIPRPNRPLFRLKANGGTNASIPVPYLIAPANGKQNVPMNPTFEWTLVSPDNPSAYKYIIEITDPITTEITVVNIDQGTIFNLFNSLYEDRNYSWRAKAVTMAGEEGSWSATFTFRTIKYCSAGALLCSPQLTQHITNVQFGDINNPSACSAQGGYTNFNLYNDMVVGTSMPIIITAENASSSDMVGVWIDLNQNGIFTDAGEYFATTTTDNVTYSANVVIPIDAPFGSISRKGKDI